MKYKLCLQAVDLDKFIEFPEEIGKILGCTIDSGVVVERRYNDDTMVRYRKIKLEKANKVLTCEIHVIEGLIIIDSKIHPIQDVVFAYEIEGISEVVTNIRKLLASKYNFVLGEPNIKMRCKRMQGFVKVELGNKATVRDVVETFFPNQIYGINLLWHSLIQDEACQDKLLIRQLRVKLRRLRSCFIFFKRDLLGKQAYQWQRSFRNMAESLSTMRELDVAIMTCERIQKQVIASDRNTGLQGELLKVLTKMRQGENEKFAASQKLNKHTLLLARFYLWLQIAFEDETGDIKAKKFINQRLGEWIDKLEGLERQYPDFTNMEDLHKIRIKVKRFRYVLQDITIIAVNSSLIRRLKKLQDMLGFLHDDYVNALMANLIIKHNKGNVELVYETSLFLGWERAKAEEALAEIPELWNNFLTALQEWRSNQK